MKKQTQISILVALSVLSFQSFAQDVQNIQEGGISTPSNNNSTSTTSSGSSNYSGKLNRSDFKNSADFDRNQIGECDATCGVDVPPPTPGGGTTPLILNRAVAETETRTQTCQEIGHPADWIGVATQQRNYYSQNGVRVPGTETPWVTINSTCRAPYPCNVQNVTWTASGNTCNASISGAHAATVTANDGVLKTIGSANFTCNDGAFTYAGGAVCNYIPSNCSGTAAWGACSRGGVALNHGTSAWITAASGGVGGATVSCNDGVFSYSGTSCAANCSNQGVSWNVAGNVCSGSTGSATHGNNVSVGNTAASRSGSATYRCNNGTWNYQSGSCTIVYSACPTITISRPASYGYNCTFRIDSAAHGVTRRNAGFNSYSSNGITVLSVSQMEAWINVDVSAYCNNGTWQWTGGYICYATSGG